MSFIGTDTRLFYSRQDANDLRLGDLTFGVSRAQSPSELTQIFSKLQEKEPGATKQTFVIAGYPDDEGISINSGRPGAKEAPDAVRKPLYKMTPPLLKQKEFLSHIAIVDLGNLDVNLGSLIDRHEVASSFALECLRLNANWIGLGGGHDYGFPDAKAYIEWCRLQGERPLILNFDAHLDVRPWSVTSSPIPSSGTPFYRMLEQYPDVDFAEVGIQSHCNSRTHYDWALTRGARILMNDGTQKQTLTEQFLSSLSDWLTPQRSVFISVDIDGFSSSIAPGCSQSWATGFTASDFFACLEHLKRILKIKVLGIYEVSPPLDLDDRTSKLAAQIVHRVLA